MDKTVKLSIFLLNPLIHMMSLVVNPVLVELWRDFPGININQLRLISSIPTLFLIIFSIIGNLLAKKIEIKIILLTGIGLYFIGGVGGAFQEKFYFLLICRAMLGMGSGFILPFANPLVYKLAADNEKGKMIGLSSAITNLISVLIGLFSGILAKINWRYSFYIYSLSAVVLLLNFYFLPDQGKVEESSERYKLPPAIFILSIFSFLTTTISFILMTNLSILLNELRISNTILIGSAQSIFLLFGVIAGLLLPKMEKKFPYFLPDMIFLSVAAGFYGLGKFSIPIISFLCLSIIGFGIGIANPFIMHQAIRLSPSSKTTFISTFVFLVGSVGGFLNPFTFSLICNWSNSQTTQGGFYTISLFLIFISLLTIGSSTYLLYRNKSTR